MCQNCLHTMAKCCLFTQHVSDIPLGPFGCTDKPVNMQWPLNKTKNTSLFIYTVVGYTSEQRPPLKRPFLGRIKGGLCSQILLYSLRIYVTSSIFYQQNVVFTAGLAHYTQEYNQSCHVSVGEKGNQYFLLYFVYRFHRMFMHCLLFLSQLVENLNLPSETAAAEPHPHERASAPQLEIPACSLAEIVTMTIQQFLQSH